MTTIGHTLGADIPVAVDLHALRGTHLGVIANSGAGIAVLRAGGYAGRARQARQRRPGPDHQSCLEASMADAICPICDRDFKAPKRQKYCSVSCANKAKSSPEPDPRPCRGCGTVFTPRFRWHARQAFCTQRCATRHAVTSPNHRKNLIAANRRRGDEIRGSGKSAYVKRGGRAEHRVVMEQELGRALTSDEIVHHIDGNTRNNDPSNLEITTRSEHAKMHGAGGCHSRKVARHG